MEPTILWQSVFNEIFILILVFAHVDGVLAAARCEVIDHWDRKKGEYLGGGGTVLTVTEGESLCGGRWVSGRFVGEVAII